MTDYLDNIVVALMAAVGVVFHVRYFWLAFRSHRPLRPGFATLKILAVVVLVGSFGWELMAVAGLHTPGTREMARWITFSAALVLAGNAVANRGGE